MPKILSFWDGDVVIQYFFQLFSWRNNQLPHSEFIYIGPLLELLNVIFGSNVSLKHVFYLIIIIIIF